MADAGPSGEAVPFRPSASPGTEDPGGSAASGRPAAATESAAPADSTDGAADDDGRKVRPGPTVAIALLLAVPPGVGMAIGVGVAAGLPPAHPLVIGGGAGLTLAILTLVLRSVLAGSPDPDRR